MRLTTQWIVVGAVALGAGAGFFGSLKARQDRPSSPQPVTTPTRSVAPPGEDRELEAIKNRLKIEYQPPADRQPQSSRPRERWLAPTLYVTGRIEQATPPQLVTGGVIDAEEAGPEVEGSSEPKPEDAVRLALRHKRALLEHCYNMELRKQASFDAFMVISLSVSAAGRVTHVKVLEADHRSSAVGACIAGEVRKLKLPVVAYDADLILPIRLEAKDLPVS